jgi:glycosyltransferase involved in cell wall biosynthesis
MSSASAIIPVYNDAATIESTLDSALALSHECDLEVVVADDGSTDATPIMLERYRDRVKIVRQEHQGVSAARNHAVRESTRDYLAFLDADDLWLPGRLRRATEVLDANPKVGLVYSPSQIADLKTGICVGECGSYGPPSIEEMFECRVIFQTSAVTMRRQIFERCGGFDERCEVGEDFLLWLNARQCCDFAFIPEPLAIWRQTGDLRDYGKYPLAARKAHVRVMRERHGLRAKTAIRVFRDFAAQNLLTGFICQIDDGNAREALWTLMRLLCYRPSYLLKKISLKVASPRNRTRLAKLAKAYVFGDQGRQKSTRSNIRENRLE